MSAKIVVCDTETDSLRTNRLPWEIAMVASQPGEVGGRRWTRHHLYVDTVDPAKADPVSLKIGQWHERFPHAALNRGEPSMLPGQRYEAEAAAKIVQAVTRDAWIVGANPAFDMLAMQNLLDQFGLEPGWKYRPVCVENYVAAQQDPPILPKGLADTAKMVDLDPEEYDLHTAVGDARLTLAVAWKSGLLNEEGDVW